MVSENGAILTEYLNKSHLQGGAIRMNTKLILIESLIMAKRKGCLVGGRVTLFLSVLRQNH